MSILVIQRNLNKLNQGHLGYGIGGSSDYFAEASENPFDRSDDLNLELPEYEGSLGNDASFAPSELDTGAILDISSPLAYVFTDERLQNAIPSEVSTPEEADESATGLYTLLAELDGFVPSEDKSYAIELVTKALLGMSSRATKLRLRNKKREHEAIIARSNQHTHSTATRLLELAFDHFSPEDPSVEGFLLQRNLVSA